MSIRAKLLTLIVVASFTAALVVTGVSVWRDAARFTEGKRAEIRAMAQVFSSAAAEAVRARSAGEASRVLRAIARIPGVLTASIVLPDGRPLAAMGESVRLVREGDGGGAFAVLNCAASPSPTSANATTNNAETTHLRAHFMSATSGFIIGFRAHKPALRARCLLRDAPQVVPALCARPRAFRASALAHRAPGES